MRHYNLKLQCVVDADNYDIKRACNSVDLQLEKKMTHQVSMDADLSDFQICLIYGNSGSGKTTFAKHVWGENIFQCNLNLDESILTQINDKFSYDEKAEILSSIGLSSIPQWVKPLKVLSNGEFARAKMAYLLSYNDILFIDEFTSTLDRNVAKITAFSVQKFIRKHNKKLVVCSVHEDVKEWLNADIELNMNDQIFFDRRLLWQSFKRKEKIKFTIKEVPRNTWKHFSKYHYLSENLPGGKLFLYGLFLNEKQIGFQCFANYNPQMKKMFHSNRTVILPEYTGFGLGGEIINITSKIMKEKGFDVRAKFSVYAVHKQLLKSKNWKFLGKSNNLNKSQFKPGGKMANQNGQRKAVTTYNYKFI